MQGTIIPAIELLSPPGFPVIDEAIRIYVHFFSERVLWAGIVFIHYAHKIHRFFINKNFSISPVSPGAVRDAPLAYQLRFGMVKPLVEQRIFSCVQDFSGWTATTYKTTYNNEYDQKFHQELFTKILCAPKLRF